MYIRTMYIRTIKKREVRNDRNQSIISALCIENCFHEEEWQSTLMKKEKKYIWKETERVRARLPGVNDYSIRQRIKPRLLSRETRLQPT